MHERAVAGKASQTALWSRGGIAPAAQPAAGRGCVPPPPCRNCFLPERAARLRRRWLGMSLAASSTGSGLLIVSSMVAPPSHERGEACEPPRRPMRSLLAGPIGAFLQYETALGCKYRRGCRAAPARRLPCRPARGRDSRTSSDRQEGLGRTYHGLGKQTVERVFRIIKRVMGWSQITFNRTAVEPDE